MFAGPLHSVAIMNTLREGGEVLQTVAELDRYADAGVRAFLAAYGSRHSLIERLGL